jgi:UDP-N-acetylmuramoyl-tripeptide--D-alanyl-D-alanine ligase
VDIKLDELLKETGGKSGSDLKIDFPIHRICTDTRLIEKNDVFFAFSGQRYDGHEFVSAAVEKGAKHLVVSESKKIPVELQKKANIIRVKDTVKAYGDLAGFYRRQFKIPAVAVTGSVGKTTVKELVTHLLSPKFKVLKNRGTENNLIGVPKTLFQLNTSHEVIVLEMGTNQPGEIERLSALISPQIGILTQISPCHLEGLKNLEGVRQEKLKLLQSLERGGVLILNGEDPWLKNVQSGVHKIRRVGFSKENVDLAAEQVWCREDGVSFSIAGQRFDTQLMGKHNLINCLLAIECAVTLGVTMPLLQGSLSSFKPVPGRLCLKNIGGILFLDDSYNSNPGSLRAALETLKSFKTRGKKGVVIGDMLELGAESEALHREMGAFAAGLLFDFMIVCGEQTKFLLEGAVKEGYDQSRIYHAKDSAAAAKYCQTLVGPGDLVLVKGSRTMRMEKVLECFINCSTP